MPTLDKAIEEQITRLSEEPVVQNPNTEVENLLQAFIRLIKAYLQRLGVSEERPYRISDTFGSNA